MTNPTPLAASDIEVISTPYQALIVSANNMSGEKISLSKGQWATLCKMFKARFEDLPDTLNGADLKRLRLKHNLTQQDVARALDVAESTVRRWERGVGDEVSEAEPAPAKPLTLRELIERQGLSVSRLAEEMGFGRHTVGNWIGGRGLPHLSPSQTLKLLQLLGCTLEELALAFNNQEEAGNTKEPALPTLLGLIKRRGLNIGEFAQAVEAAWAPITGRPLSRDAVSAWVNGRVRPRMQPEELQAILEILDCSLEEFLQGLRVYS